MVLDLDTLLNQLEQDLNFDLNPDQSQELLLNLFMIIDLYLNPSLELACTWLNNLHSDQNMDPCAVLYLDLNIDPNFDRETNPDLDANKDQNRKTWT